MHLPIAKIKELIRLMNTNSEIRIPALPPVIQCFELAMCEETLDFLLACGLGEHSKEELREIYREVYLRKNATSAKANDDGRNANDEMTYGSATDLSDDAGFCASWDKVWSEVYEMSFLMPGETDSRKYILTTIFPGWIELSTAGEITEKRKAILDKFMEFWRLLKLINFGPVRAYFNAEADRALATKAPTMSTLPATPATAPGSKEIVLNRPLTSEQQVRPATDIYELLARHKDEIAVMNCICRLHRELDGESCGFGLPLESCINLGPLSKQLVDNGISRHLTFDEACDLVEDMEKKGCIHTLFHYQNHSGHEAFNICNCCNDCCLLYASPLKGSISHVFVKSFYAPREIDLSRCVGCNLCGKYCATGATYYDKQTKKLVFNYEDCVGCGQCVTQCRFDVREMVRDERSVYVKTKKR